MNSRAMLHVSMYVLLVLVMVVLLLGVFFGLRTLRSIIRGYAVPNVSTPSRLLQALAQECVLRKGDVFIDMGCGEGDVLKHMYTHYPDASFIGIEANTFPYTLAVQKSIGTSIEIQQGNFFETDISGATHLYCYLMPHVMKKVWDFVQVSCSSGTLLFVNAFPIPDSISYKEIDLGSHGTFSRKLYVYQV